MARSPKPPQPPADQPAVPPRELYDNYDIRIVMLKLGEIGNQVSDMRESHKALVSKQEEIEKKLIRFDATIKVAGGAIALFLTFFWFMFGGDIKSLRDQVIIEQARAATIQPAAANTQQTPD